MAKNSTICSSNEFQSLLNEFEEADASTIYLRICRLIKLSTQLSKKVVEFWEKSAEFGSKFLSKEDEGRKGLLLEESNWMAKDFREFKVLTLERTAFLPHLYKPGNNFFFNLWSKYCLRMLRSLVWIGSNRHRTILHSVLILSNKKQF